MTSKPSRPFSETTDLFGPPPEDSRLNELQTLLNSMLGQKDIEPGLRQAMALAERGESDIYADAAISAIDLMVAGVEFEKLKAFFHHAAAYGEARYASRLLSNIHLAVLLRSAPTDVH